MADVEMQIRVRYHEVDRMGVVYHPRYLAWYEMARIEMLRAAGLPYDQLEAGGLGLPVTRVESRHHRPLRFDEWLRLECTLGARGGARFTLHYAVFRGDERIADATTEHAAVRLPEGRPTRLPDALRRALDRLPSQGGDLPTVYARDPVDVRLGPP